MKVSEAIFILQFFRIIMDGESEVNATAFLIGLGIDIRFVIKYIIHRY